VINFSFGTKISHFEKHPTLLSNLISYLKINLKSNKISHFGIKI